MILITAALLSLVVAIILVWPVIRRGDPGLGRAAYDLTVFQDQLKEVERDVARRGPDFGRCGINHAFSDIRRSGEAPGRH